MSDFAAFLELLAQLEGQRSVDEWRETWAGILVLRLYHLWLVNPAVTDGRGSLSRAAEAAVTLLPETTASKPHLTSIVSALAGASATHRDRITRALADYAMHLVQRG